VIYVSDLKQVMVSDGSNWIPFLNTSTNQTVNGNITFAGQQIFNGLHRLSVTTDSSSTGAVTALNNVTPVTEFTAAVTSISGIVNSASGATVMLVNRTGSTLAILDEDASATAANRIRTGTGAQVALANNASVILTYVGDNRWHIVGGSGSSTGGSGGINYITNGTAEADTVGWAVYAESDAVTFQDTGDTVTLNSHGLSNGNQISFTSIVSTTGISTNTLYFVISATTNTFQVATTATGSALPLTTNGSGTMVRFAPKVGTGGSANVTITRTTTTPLVGAASFLLAKDAANRQGQGWSYDFTIDLANRAKVLQISFDYLVNSGTFVAGATGSNSDVTVWIYDVTNAVVIQPSNIKLFSNNASISDKFQASFQTASNSSSYRLIIHVTSTSASAYTLEVDSVSVSPSDYVFGTPVTDWQSYTPTFQGFGTPTNVEMRWRRVGDNVEIQGRFTSGTTTAVEARVGLPTGLTSSSSKISTIQQTGTVGFAVNSGYYLTLMEPSKTYFTIGIQVSSAGLTKLNASSIITSGNILSFTASIPIEGWSSSVQTSDSADTRVVAARATKSADQSIVTTATTAVTWNTYTIDTHGGFSGNTYTIPVSGVYKVAITVDAFNITSGASGYINIYIQRNGSNLQGQYYYVSGTGDSIQTNSGLFQFVAGDQITFAVNSPDGNYNLRATATFCTVERLSGPSAIAASETVAASYWASANGTATSTSPINFDSKEFDSHGAVTTGAAWKFTAPISGTYQVNAFGLATAANLTMFIYKNGSNYKYFSQVATAGYGATGATMIRLNAGDYIDIRPPSAFTMYGGTLTSGNACHVSISRVGN
jgi:hypothetical protein